jgi:hypothetical protein
MDEFKKNILIQLENEYDKIFDIVYKKIEKDVKCKNFMSYYDDMKFDAKIELVLIIKNLEKESFNLDKELKKVLIILFKMI